MTTPTDHENSILKTAILIEEDAVTIDRLVQIRESNVKGRQEFLKGVIANRTFKDPLDLSSNDLLHTTFLNALFHNSKTKKTLNFQDITIADDLLLAHFVDLAKPKSVQYFLREENASLQDIILKETVALHEFDFKIDKPSNQMELAQGKVKEIEELYTLSNQEELILQLTNSLYKQILFGNFNAPIFRKKAIKDAYKFKTSVKNFSSIKELFESIDDIPDDEFSKYAKNNDFQNWLSAPTFTNDAEIKTQAKQLAKNLKKIKSKKDLSEKIIKHAKKIEERRLKTGKGQIKSNSKAMMAASIFLNGLRPELKNLIPKISSKEGVKLLKIVQDYIEKNASDDTKKGLINFLLNPEDYLQKNESSESLSYKTNFADHFKENIGYAIIEKSGIEKDITVAAELMDKNKPISKASFTAYTDSFKSLSEFIEKYKNQSLPSMEIITIFKNEVEEKIEQAKEKIAAERLRFSQSVKNVSSICKRLKSFSKKPPTKHNLQVYSDCLAETRKNETVISELEPEVVPEFTEYQEQKNALQKAINDRTVEIVDFFTSETEKLNKKITEHPVDTKQDIDSLDDILNDAQEKIELAKLFYENNLSDIFRIPETIGFFQNKYWEYNQAWIEEIDDAILILDAGINDIEKRFKDPEKLKLNVEKSTVPELCDIIRNLEDSAEEHKINFENLRKDAGFSEKLKEFDSTVNSVTPVITAAKQAIQFELQDAAKELRSDALMTYEYSQEKIALSAIESKAEKLKELAEKVGLEEEKQNFAKTAKIANQKIEIIDLNVKQNKKSLSKFESKFKLEQNKIQNKYDAVKKQKVLSSILSSLNKIDKKFTAIKELKEDEKLAPSIESLEQRIRSLNQEVDFNVEKAISLEKRKTKNLADNVKNPKKEDILKTICKLKNRKIYLSRLNKGKYSEEASKHHEEASKLFEKANAALAGFKSGIDAELANVLDELKQDYIWSVDKEKIAEQKDRIDEIAADAALIEYAEKEVDINDAKAFAEQKTKDLDSLIKENKQKIIRIDIENKHKITSFDIVCKIIEDEYIIEKSQALIKDMTTSLDSVANLIEDPEYSKLFEEAKETIANKRISVNNDIIDRINKKDQVIDTILELAEKRELGLSEFKKLKQSTEKLEELKQNYLVFNKDIFKEIVAQKIEQVEETSKVVQKKINEISDHLDNQIETISADISDDTFVYSQHLPALYNKEIKLKDILQFCQALENDALLESIEDSKNKIAEVRKTIQDNFNERKTKTSDILENALNTKKSVEKLISTGLTDTNLIQAYLLLHESENSIKNIDDEWKKDEHINEICNDAESTIQEIRKSLEDNIFAEVTKIDAAAQQCKRVVDAAALQSPEKVKNFLAAESSLKVSAKNYSALLKHEHKELLSEKKAEISATLKTASNMINTLKEKLSEEVSHMEKQAKAEHNYTQDKNKLKAESNRIIELSDFLKALNNDEELERVETAKLKIDEKAKQIQEKIVKKRKELGDLHKSILFEGKETLAELWKDIHSEGNLAEAHKLIKDTREKVQKQGRWRMDDELTSVFSRIDEALNNLQNYQFNKAKKEINEHFTELKNLEIMLSSLNLSTPEQAKSFKEEAEKLDEISELLKDFKEISSEYDTAFALNKASDIATLIEERYETSRRFVSEQVAVVTNRLYETELIEPQQIAVLKMMKTELEPKKEMCSIINRSTDDIDFVIGCIDERIELIEETKSKQEKEFALLLDNLEFAKNKIETLLENKIDKQVLETALNLINYAKKESEDFFSEYKKEDLKQVDLKINPVDAVEKALSEFFNGTTEFKAEQIIANMKNQVAEKVNSELQTIDAKIKDCADEAYFTYDLKELNKLKEKAANCLIKEYNQFNIGSFSRIVSNKRKEQMQVFNKIEKKLSDVFEYQKKKIAEIKSDKNDLISFISKSNYLAKQIRLKKEAGSFDLLTSPLYNEYIQLSLDFRKKTKQIDQHWTALKVMPKKKDIFAKEYLENKNYFLLNDHAFKEATVVQREACALIREQLNLYSNILLQPLTSEDSLDRLKQAYKNLRSERVQFNEFKKHLRNMNKSLASGFAEEYKNLIRKAVTILHPLSDEEKLAQRRLENLQSIMISFNKDCSELFSDALDHPDKENIDKVITLNYSLQTIQEETEAIESINARGAYMRSLMQEVHKNNRAYTQTFAENMGLLIQNINSVKKLKSANISGTLSGGFRSVLRKATRVFTREHKKEDAVVEELEKIKQYHEEYLAN